MRASEAQDKREAGARRRRRRAAAVVICLTGVGLVASACDGPQSTLAAAGPEAREIAGLFWVMAIAGGLIWAALMSLLIYALMARPKGERFASALVWIGGVAAPGLLLTALLAYALPLMPALRDETGIIAIDVEGHQYWWRVKYVLPDGRMVETANEVKLPVHARSELRLSSADVIHSFWVPSLAGKMDMVPGRTNRLVLRPDKTGLFRGVCAEFCGQSHAFMAFNVEALAPDAFSDWLRRQHEEAAASVTLEEKRGAQLFQDTGCGACHRVRGTPADGRMGPDLTHVGGRLTIAAGLLPNNHGTLAGWIAASQDLKPGNRMPSIATLAGEDLRAVAAYLRALK